MSDTVISNKARVYNEHARGMYFMPSELPSHFCDAWQEDIDTFTAEIQKFQLFHGLVDDGMCGPKTTRALIEKPWLQATPIRGKGLWVWRLEHLGKNKEQVAASIDKMAAAGIRHVLVKLGDGTSRMNKGITKYLDLFAKAGIAVFPWFFSYCYDTDKDLQREAQRHLDWSNKTLDWPKAIVVNAEKGFKSKRPVKIQGKSVWQEFPLYRQHAEMYMEMMHRSGASIYLSSYGYPKGHGNFAWHEMCEGADFLCPQSYWSVKTKYRKDPTGYVLDGSRMWRDKAPWRRPIIPSGGNYQVKDKKTKQWKTDYHRPKEIKEFLKLANEMMFPAATFWLYLRRPGAARVTDAQWDAIANHVWWEDMP